MDAFDSVAFSPDGRIIVSSGWGSITGWDVARGAETWTTLLWNRYEPTLLAFDRDGSRIAVALWNKRTDILDAATGRRIHGWREPDGVRDIAWCGPRRLVYACGTGGLMCADADSGQMLAGDSHLNAVRLCPAPRHEAIYVGCETHNPSTQPSSPWRGQS